MFLSALLSFFPKRYRETFTPYAIQSEAAILSGALETLISLGILIGRYFVFMNAKFAAVPEIAMSRAAEKHGESLVMGFGGIFLVEYVLQLTTIFLIFLSLEGAVRIVAAAGMGEVLPSFPLKALSVLHARVGAEVQERRLGQRVCDEIEPLQAGQSLQIASCRPKPWNKLLTISHKGELYELVSEQRGSSPRSFIYILRKKSLSGVIRGVYYYDPKEVLN